MDDTRLAVAFSAAEQTEREIRRHLALESGAFEQAHGMTAYRHAVALRKALEAWAAMRSRLRVKQ